MRASWLSRQWLKLWLVLLALLLCSVPIKRHLDLLKLNRQLIALIRQPAEHGYPVGSGLDPYLYGWNSPGVGPAQGPAIYLINRGYQDPQLLRVLLLSEAQRYYDHSYTYSTAINYDLRSFLSQRCLAAFPDDLKVAWAVGHLALIDGDDELACAQLGRVVNAAGSIEKLDDFAADQGNDITGQNILGRYCAALTLCGRDAEAGALLIQWHAAAPHSVEVLDRLAWWYADSGRHAELLALLDAPDAAGKLLPTATAALLRKSAYFWSGDLARYMTAAAANPTDTDKARLALLAAGTEHYASADLYAVTGDQQWLDPLERRWQALHRNMPEREGDFGDFMLWSHNAGTVGLGLARAYVLRSRWQESAGVLENIRQETSSLPWEGGFAGPLLLSRLALGERLDALFETDFEQQQAAQSDSSGHLYEYRINSESGGPLSELRESDRLTALMRSPQFAAALKAGGRTLADVLPELRRAAVPERWDYDDYSNGGLVVGAAEMRPSP